MLINKILEASRRVKNNRSLYYVSGKLQEETGEVATEVAIAAGDSDKESGGKDGLIGECVDVILAAVDLMYVHNPDITEEALMEKVEEKLDKWILNQIRKFIRDEYENNRDEYNRNNISTEIAMAAAKKFDIQGNDIAWVYLQADHIIHGMGG